jgi:hypothetical protein
LQGKKCKKFNFFQNQNNTCAQLFMLVIKFHDRQSSERCIRKLISRHCLEKTRTRWNDFLFLITDDRDFRPQTCTNGLVFRECKHIKNIFEDVYFTKNLFHITLTIMEKLCTNKNNSYKDNEQIHKQNIYNSKCFGVKFVKIYPEMISR